MKNQHAFSLVRALLTMSLFSLFLSACSLPNTTATKAAAKASGTFSDGEILRVLKTLNEGEIAQAELVSQRSDNQQLQNAAERIIEDHKENNERVEAMVQSGIELERSPLSRGLRLQSEEITEELTELRGTEFDCTYLEKQIEQHQLALDTVRSHLLPDAKDSEVRRLLSETAPALQHHLQSAQETRDNLTQCTS